MMDFKKHIPNFITCGNLFCGCLAVVSAFNGNLVWAAYLVGIAAVLDFLDGFVARLLNVSGEMGKQLDSLADMVTFGLVPGVVLYQIIFGIYFKPEIIEPLKAFDLGALMDVASSFFPGIEEVVTPPWYMILIPFSAFLITVFSALRLAKFNIDTRQSDSFIGVPTPANTILICSLPLIVKFQPYFFNLNIVSIIYNVYFLIGLIIIMSYLLVAELPLFALKFKNFTWSDNKIRYIFLIISVLLLIVFHFIAIPFIIFLYILLSILNNSLIKTN